MLDPNGRVILISGASRGIGLALAKALLARGYSLSLGLRDPARPPAGLAGAPTERLHLARFEAQERATHQRWIEAALARFGRIDGLVNNAGVNATTTLRDDDEAELDRVFAINVKAPLNLIRLALPHLEASGAGRIVNVASLSGKRVPNENVAYAMSKFALIAMTHAARRAAWEKGVRATALCPSFVRTDMTADVVKFPREKMSDPADIAELVATVIALPNTASVAELLVNCKFEEML
ncbi:MAG: SDR family NAD(P)-dependent oxidoreductase [Methylobacteriaceae bacterium]|nr:SDR family NAD(P)-dependent oxidoreductase [Methylobacteriaceae bacterium]